MPGSIREIMATSKSRTNIRPAKDEWGVYDPEQAGIAALLSRLDKQNTRPAAVSAGPSLRNDIPEPVLIPGRPTLRDAK